MGSAYESLTLPELEAAHQKLDAEVAEAREKMLTLHQLMEPKRIALQRTAAGPAHLAQTLSGPEVKLG